MGMIVRFIKTKSTGMTQMQNNMLAENVQHGIHLQVSLCNIYFSMFG